MQLGVVTVVIDNLYNAYCRVDPSLHIYTLASALIGQTRGVSTI